MAQQSADQRFYVGFGVGKSSWKDACAQLGGSCDDTDNAFKVLGGYQFNRYFAGEFGLVDLGSAIATFGGARDEVKAKAWELTAVGSAPIVDRFSIFGRFGVYFAEVKENTNFAGNFSHSNNDLTYGFGVRYDFTRNLAMRGEFQRYSDVGGGPILTSDVDVVSLSVLWMF